MPQAPIDELDRLIADFEVSKRAGNRRRPAAERKSTPKGDKSMAKPRNSKPKYSRSLMTKVVAQLEAATIKVTETIPAKVVAARASTPANASEGK